MLSFAWTRGTHRPYQNVIQSLHHFYCFFTTSPPLVCHTPTCARGAPQDSHHAACTHGQRLDVVRKRSCGSQVETGRKNLCGVRKRYRLLCCPWRSWLWWRRTHGQEVSPVRPRR